MTEPSHRRDFVRTLALGASAAALAAPVPLCAEEPGKKPPAEPAAQPRSEVDARMELVLERFGEQLDADAAKSVREEVEAIVRRAELLRKFRLENGDGPYPGFTPYRAPLS